MAHVVLSSSARVRESTVVRRRVHCLGKAGCLGEGGQCLDLPNAAAETQIVSKTLALSPGL